ncbi:MAG TPA: carboxymuconolactone decarboxylase family protein [Solirubrobacteraceae bacterium]|nr:carboxymuconolactone decarboxylase family protein [Solirubrobacteraceae bacterium]
MTPVPLAKLPDDVAAQVGDAGAKQVNLYRCLAHAPELLRAWITFAWALRGNSATSRRMRELMILRTAMLHESRYEWHQHVHMATQLGVEETEIAQLESWQTSSLFDQRTKAALAFTDAIVEGRVPAHINAELAAHFNETQRIELTVTAAFYSMVPRVLDALDVPIEEEFAEATPPPASTRGPARS